MQIIHRKLVSAALTGVVLILTIALATYTGFHPLETIGEDDVLDGSSIRVIV